MTARVHLDMPLTRAPAALLLACTVSALACSRRDAPPRGPERETAAPPSAPPVPDSFLVALTTSRGPMGVVGHRPLAPHRAGRVFAPGPGGLYDCARFFPVV